MKSDMAGAAAVLATFRAVAELGIATSLVAAVPFADNMTGSDAMHPGDVLTHRGGRTAEVVDTDSEGRLVVADALAYLCERNPAAVVDVATLTDAGGLGDGLWAVLGTDRVLVGELLEAGRAAGDPGWELPLPDAYVDLLRSPVADIRNAPSEGVDTTVMAALYLRASSATSRGRIWTWAARRGWNARPTAGLREPTARPPERSSGGSRHGQPRGGAENAASG